MLEKVVVWGWSKVVVGSREVILCGWVGGSGVATKKLQVCEYWISVVWNYFIYFLFLKRGKKMKKRKWRQGDGAGFRFRGRDQCQS
jgi:hypothetical protein